MICFCDVTQHYGIRAVLRNINLQIPSGLVTAIVGPNGMGKSTLLKTAAGILNPQQGYVQINGLVRRSFLDTELQIRRQVVYVPDKPWLPPEISGRELLLRVGRLYQVDDKRLMSHSNELFAIFDLMDQADRPIGSYSNGQKHKVAICCAIVCDTSILLLDEPFSNGLDPAGILALKKVLRHQSTQLGKTVLIATPIPDLVQEVADHVILIKDGKVFAHGSLADLQLQFRMRGSLAQVLEQAMHPETEKRVDQYLMSNV